MRKIQILGAFIAVLAFSALAVSSASATLWLRSGASLSAETSTPSHGEITLHHELLGSRSAIKCKGLFIGTVGPEALGLVTLVEGEKGEKDLVLCTLTEDKGLCGTVGEILTVHALLLPWHSLLELVSGKTVNRILKYHWEALCRLGPILCIGEDLQEFTKNGTNGAIFEFPGTTPATECSDLGSTTTTGLGEALGATVS